MKGHCNQCGNCCEAITIGMSLRQLRAVRFSGNAKTDRAFILKHWRRVSGTKGETKFSCDMFDPSARICTAHDERPPICRDYPWYGKTPSAGKLAIGMPESKECSYWFDIPKKERPADATPVSLKTRKRHELL